ncbi:alpha/beta fold hydrolase [Celerinatantimonas sp. MCCC 1A17872]|uniref:alpha/beta fold hydrolase n=1 Tax=Celerinatantimonas sp. MCCC 1A17872 TaxID=3177514 RepID=UPI0038BE55EB
MTEQQQILDNLSPVVLIRGLLGEHYYWQHFQQMLEQTLQRKVILVSLREQLSSQTQSSAALVETFRDLLYSQTQSHQCHVVSLSLGANAALYWQQQFSDEVKSVTLINPLVIDKTQRWHPLLWWLLSKIVVLSMFTSSHSKRWFKRLSAWPGLHPELIEQPSALSLHSWQLVKQFKLFIKASCSFSPKVALQLLVSRHDHWISASLSYRLAAIWQAPLFPHLSGGHDLALDDPRWVCEKLTDWVTHYD